MTEENESDWLTHSKAESHTDHLQVEEPGKPVFTQYRSWKPQRKRHHGSAPSSQKTAREETVQDQM